MLGGLLFLADALLISRGDDPRTIRVTAAVDNEARSLFKSARGREPNADELKALRERWIDNEVLYREGLALRVDQGDIAIRERVIFKSLSLVEAGLKLPPIDDARLRAWFESHRAKYDEPPRYDFQEAVLVDDTSEAAVRNFVAALNAGTPGDAQAGLRVFKARPRDNLLQSYGEQFVAALEAASPGEWRALPSNEGVRAVRLDRTTPARAAEFEVLRGVALQDWTAAGNRAAADDLAVAWPDGCSAEETALHCGPAGLSGTLSVDGVGKRYSAAVIKVFWADGQERGHTLTPTQPSVRLFGSADDPRGVAEIASAYTLLGVEHILTGFDHLMFVIALLFLVGCNRKLFFTITAFTVAHSLTLASSALGLLTLRPPPVEATIALSIVLVAGEALHDRPTLARRWPALVAFLFGLVHGLGFAGALKEIGLPDNFAWMALLTFNVGVEIGQLLVVGIALVFYRWVRALPLAMPARTAALYAIGSVAAYWSLARIAALTVL